MGNTNKKQQEQQQQKDWLSNSIKITKYQRNSYGEVYEQIQFDPLKNSQFNQLKEQGNTIYKKIVEECQKKTLAKQIIQQNLCQSQLYYEEAQINAQYFSQKAQIHKNIAMVNFKKIQYKCDEKQNINLLYEGIKNVNMAVDYSQQKNQNPDQWYNQLYDIKFQAARNVINTILNKQDDIELQNNLIELSNKISLKLEPQIHLIIQKYIINRTEKQIYDLNSSDNIKDMIQAENLQQQINLNIQKFYSLSKEFSSEEIQQYFEDRVSKIDESTIQYQSYRYLYLANQIYKSEQERKIIQSDYNLEESNVIQEAIDAYKFAISVVKSFEGKFLDIEGECSFMLSQIYFEINGDQCLKARNYLNNSISFYLNSNSCNRSRCKKWYLEAEQKMKLLQKRNNLDDSQFEEWKTDNSQLVEQIKKNQKNGCVDFIKWAVKNHLPQNNKKFQFKQADFYSNKKLVIKCMRIYHGDKIVNETQHFKFIAKCIMQELSNFLDKIKEEQKEDNNQYMNDTDCE